MIFEKLFYDNKYEFDIILYFLFLPPLFMLAQMVQARYSKYRDRYNLCASLWINNGYGYTKFQYIEEEVWRF